MSWPLVKLGDHVSHVSSGATPRGGSSNYMTSGPVMFLRSQNVHMNELRLDDVIYVSDEIHQKMKRSIVQFGDVLINITGASIGRVTPFDIKDIKVNSNQHVCSIRPNADTLDFRYLSYFLGSEKFQRSIFSSQRGGTREALTYAQIRDFLIPLPPLPEQKRIAAILDKADQLRQKRQQAIGLADEFLRSVFLDMFGDLVFNPHNYGKQSIESLSISDGVKCGPFGTQLGKHEYVESGIPLWGIKHVNKDFKLPTDEFLTEEKAGELSAYSILSGDIVMTRKGTVGNCHVYPESFGTGVMHSDLLRIRLDTSLMDPYFLSWQLKLSRDVIHQISLISSGAIMAGINVGKLKKINVCVPELSQQIAFRDIIFKQESLKKMYSLGDFELFNSLSQNAFSGEL